MTAARDIVTDASTSVVGIAPHYGLFIGGEFVEPIDGTTFRTVNPATEEALAEVSEGGSLDVDRAVRAARGASRTWSKTSGADRARYLYRIARLVQERSRELAMLEALDSGRPIRLSRDVDIPRASAYFFYYAGWADKLEYAGYGSRSYGVAAQILRWNVPLLLLARKVAPALACGNTIVLKPAETTPLTALAFADICQQVGLPDGVVNIVTGDAATGRALVEHPDVDKIVFTGSREVGKQIQRAVAGTRKSLTLDLSSLAVNIIFDDAPIDAAIEGIVEGIFMNAARNCAAGARLLVQEPVIEAVVDRLKVRLGTLRLADPLDKSTDVGPIGNPDQYARLQEWVRAGETDGGERWSAPCVLPDRGWWFPPTIVTGVPADHHLGQDEVVGPAMSVLAFRTPEEAVAQANTTPSGLCAGVWSETGARALWTASRLRAGVVWTNTFGHFDPTSPIGGVGESGFGREGGREGLAPYLRAEVV